MSPTIQYIAKRYHFFLCAQSPCCVSFNNCVIYFKCRSPCRKFNSLKGTIPKLSIVILFSGHEVNLCMIFHIERRKKISLFYIFVEIVQFRDVGLIWMTWYLFIYLFSFISLSGYTFSMDWMISNNGQHRIYNMCGYTKIYNILTGFSLKF